VIGTSALVYPAAGLPEIARAAGAYLVEVNPERTPLSELCDESLNGKAGEILPLFEKR
jgi:NAD-dependent deacetylase